MSNPVVSIITPSYNRADIVHETAASIFNQTYPHWEWMIVEDGSTDNSWEVIQEYARKDSRVKALKRERLPKGACACRNIAIENSTGEYLIFLDTDDLMAPYCLRQRVAAMQAQPECDFIIFPMLLFKKQPDDLRTLWNVDSEDDDLLRLLLGDPVCQGTGPLWKKKSFQHIGMWREDLLLWQDIELHIRSFLWPMKYAKRMDLPPDVFLRISDVSLSRTGFHSLPKFKSRIEVIKYAIEKVSEKGLLQKYTDGLRYMACDIIAGLIRSGYKVEADELISFCERKQVFTKKETGYFKAYRKLHSMKLYKIPTLMKKAEQRIDGLKVATNSLLEKYKWEQPIQF